MSVVRPSTNSPTTSPEPNHSPVRTPDGGRRPVSTAWVTARHNATPVIRVIGTAVSQAVSPSSHPAPGDKASTKLGGCAPRRVVSTWSPTMTVATPVRNTGSGWIPNNITGSVSDCRRRSHRGCVRHNSRKDANK